MMNHKTQRKWLRRRRKNKKNLLPNHPFHLMRKQRRERRKQKKKRQYKRSRSCKNNKQVNYNKSKRLYTLTLRTSKNRSSTRSSK
jgi:hypothetical protein